MGRMGEKVRLAEKAGVRLLHENEHRIYGDSPERVKELFTKISSPAFRAAYDPANYVYCGYDPCSCVELVAIKMYTYDPYHCSYCEFSIGAGAIKTVRMDPIRRCSPRWIIWSRRNAYR